MKPYNVLNMNEHLPKATNSMCQHTIQKLPVEKAHVLTEDETIEKRIILHLSTFQDMKAAHFFVYGEEETTWHLFSPSQAPLRQIEIGGHIRTGISEVVSGRPVSAQKFKQPLQRCVKMGKQVRSFYTRLDCKKRVFAILVFKDFIFIAGNAFGESSLCKAYMGYEKPQNVSKSRKENSLNRLAFDYRKKQDIFNIGSILRESKNVIRIVK